MYLADRLRINPSSQARELLWEISYICKDVWNILNDEKRESWVGYYDLKKMLPELKEYCDRLKQPSSQVLQEVVKSLNSAWRMFFTKHRRGDKEVRPPRFKSYKYFFTQKYPQRGISCEIIGSTLRLAYGSGKADWIEIALPEVEYSYDTIKTITVSYDKTQKNWYISLAREIQEPDAAAFLPKMNGMDQVGNWIRTMEL
jgi:transposase